MRLLVLAASLGLVATPSLALTVSSAPPRPDVAQRLAPSGPAAPGLQESFVGAGRPTAGANFTGAPTAYGSTSFGFGPVRTTVTSDPRGPRWLERRETPRPCRSRHPALRRPTDSRDSL